MYKIGPVRVTKGTFGSYRNITNLKPTGKTGKDLTRAFYEVRNSKEDQAGRCDALEVLGKAYENLSLQGIFSGEHSFIKLTLERIATDENDELRAYASEIVGISREYIYPIEKVDEPLQRGSDFSDRLLEATPAKNEDEVMGLYAIAKHGVGVAAVGAGNQLALLSIGAFSEASTQRLDPLAGFLLKELIESEVDRHRIDGWDSMGKLSMEHVFSEIEQRENLANLFKEDYGIRPNEIESAEELAEVLQKSGPIMHLAFSMYIKALPSVIDKKTEMLVVDFWRAFIGNGEEDLYRYVRSFYPLNRELRFIIPLR